MKGTQVQKIFLIAIIMISIIIPFSSLFRLPSAAAAKCRDTKNGPECEADPIECDDFCFEPPSIPSGGGIPIGPILIPSTGGVTAGGTGSSHIPIPPRAYDIQCSGLPDGSTTCILTPRAHIPPCPTKTDVMLHFIAPGLTSMSGVITLVAATGPVGWTVGALYILGGFGIALVDLKSLKNEMVGCQGL